MLTTFTRDLDQFNNSLSFNNKKNWTEFIRNFFKVCKLKIYNCEHNQINHRIFSDKGVSGIQLKVADS